MTGLTAPPDNSEIASETIEADGWFPGIETSHVREGIRIGEGAVTDARLRNAIEGGILSGLRSLADWRTARAVEGFSDLEAVTDETINGTNRGVVLWHRVVRFFAAAELAETHVDVSATDEAIDRDEEKRDTAEDYRRYAIDAVADLRSLGAANEEERAKSGRNRVKLL